MAGFTVQYDENNYRIVGPGGEEGEVTDIGSMASIDVGGRTYVAFLDVDPDGKDGEMPEPESQVEPVTAHVYLLGPRQVTEFKEVVFEGLDEDEGEDGEEDEPETEDDDEDDDDEGDEDEEDVVEVEENKGD